MRWVINLSSACSSTVSLSPLSISFSTFANIRSFSASVSITTGRVSASSLAYRRVFIVGLTVIFPSPLAVVAMRQHTLDVNRLANIADLCDQSEFVATYVEDRAFSHWIG